MGFDAPGIRVGLIGPRFRSQFAENHWSPSKLLFQELEIIKRQQRVGLLVFLRFLEGKRRK